MLAKTWKKIGLIILIVACLWNIVSKLVYKISFNTTIDAIKSVIQNENRRESGRGETLNEKGNTTSI